MAKVDTYCRRVSRAKHAVAQTATRRDMGLFHHISGALSCTIGTHFSHKWNPLVRLTPARRLLGPCQVDSRATSKDLTTKEPRHEDAQRNKPLSRSVNIVLHTTCRVKLLGGRFLAGTQPSSPVFLSALPQLGGRQCDIIVGAADSRCSAQVSQGETRKEGSS